MTINNYTPEDHIEAICRNMAKLNGLDPDVLLDWGSPCWMQYEQVVRDVLKAMQEPVDFEKEAHKKVWGIK